MKKKNKALLNSNKVCLIKKNTQFVVYLMLMGLFFCLTFLNLEQAPINNWDEARHGVSAYEMIQSNDYIKNTYRYETDLWNLKPPLSFWLITVFYRAFGYSSLALRLPSAICFSLSFVLLAFFIHKKYGFISTVSFMGLFMAYGDLFVVHLGRSGDPDALFNLLFVCVILLLFWTIGEEKKRGEVGFVLAGSAASMAFLTKSFHAVAIYGIIAVYILLINEKRHFRIVANVFVISLLPIVLWMILRFSVDGFDFVGSMFGVDVVARIKQFENQTQSDNAVTLIQYLISYRPAQILLCIITVSLLVLLFYWVCVRKRSIISIMANKEIQLYIIWLLLPSVIYQASSATATWYYYPIIISLITISAVLLGKSFECLTKSDWISKKRIKLVMTAGIVCVTSIALLFSVRSVGGLYENIASPFLLNDQKALFTLVSRESEFAGSTAYILKNTNSYRDLDCWEQCDVLVAELAADLKCYDGGIDAFINDQESILFITKEKHNEYFELVQDYRIVSQNEDYFVLTH